MKWKDLSLKERKQIYDSVRVNNPGATYFDIKQQFDSIPAYQDGKGKTINKADLPPEYRTGTPEYFERQRKISGAVNTVQPEAYITPAGYIKDAVNFIEDLGKGDYAGAAMDAVLNLIPWGVGKGIKKLKSKVGRIVEGTEIDGASVHSFAPTQTKRKTKKKTEEDYDSEFSEVLRKDRNSKKYQQEISRTIEQAIFPDERTRELVENVDKTYGTNYKRAYSNIAYKDMTKRGSYVKWGDTDKDGYGQINIKNIKDNILPTDINDYSVILDNNIYMPGNEYIDRLNKLIPMEILMPLGGAGFVGHELNKE